jgi:hypothetical protein
MSRRTSCHINVLRVILSPTLTKNTFNARINQGRNPCAKCSVGKRKGGHEEKIRKALEDAGCELISLNNRQVIYICHCGEDSQNWDNNILRSCQGCNDCTNPFNDPEIQEKIKATILDKYGVTNIMHHAETFAKKLANSWRTKDYTLPSGKVIPTQGYENRCWDLLLHSRNESELCLEAKDIPTISYISPTTGRPARYLPDGYIPSDNIILEVKSDWTYESIHPWELSKNKAKFRATAKAGYELHLYVYGDRKLLFREIYKMEDGKVVRLWHPAVLADIVFED